MEYAICDFKTRKVIRRHLSKDQALAMSGQRDNNIPVFLFCVYKGLHIWHIMAQDNREEWNG